jgi:hypothetical protein
MFTPNSPKDMQEEDLPEWHEPFPEPNTIPAGWNFSPVSNPSAALTGNEKDDDVEE